MSQLLEIRDPTTASLEQCCEALSVWGFDPGEEESLAHAANWLARLGNDRRFLTDRVVDLLAGRTPAGEAVVAIGGTQTHHILLSPPGRGNFAISASIWPSADEPVLRASGLQAFGYGVAHDFNFDFLTLGYHGPGVEVEEFEYDRAAIEGWRGEPVKLQARGRLRHEAGRLAHYRASRDVCRPHPPEALSVALTLAHVHPAQGWTDHYLFDIEAGRIAGVLGHGPSEAFLRIAVGMGGEEAKDLASRFGRYHPSERMRIAAWRALANAAQDEEGRLAIWREAEASGSRAVAAEARKRLGEAEVGRGALGGTRTGGG